jgi:hypothetical protein
MSTNLFIDVQDINGVSYTPWYFFDSINSGNNSGIVFSPGMNINLFIDAQDVNGFASGPWYFLASVDSGNNTGIQFTSYSGVRVFGVDVQDSFASPAFWFADGNSVDSGNNTNWIFNTSSNPSQGGVPPAFGFGFRI